MEIQNFIFLLFLIGSLSFFVYNMVGFFSVLKLGKPEDRFDRPFARILLTLKVAFGQSKIFRDPVAGPLHAFIYWGFLALSFAVLESAGKGLYDGFSFSFLGWFHSVLLVTQDIFIVIVGVAVLISLARRFFFRPERLNVGKPGLVDATVVLTLILFIMLATLGENATDHALGVMNEGTRAGGERFVSIAAANLFIGMEGGDLQRWHSLFFWIHMTLVFGFLNYLPYSKHFHIVTSTVNVYFTSLKPKGELDPVDFEKEGTEKFGSEDVGDLTWKQILDGYACTECGRCSSVCPAHTTGKPLSPRKIIMDIRKRATEQAPLLAGQVAPDEGTTGDEKKLLHSFVTPEELWACTTCLACVQECPVNIEHVGTIVDLRRHLVMMESAFPPELQTVFRNLENNFSPWAFSPAQREEWTEGMEIQRIYQDPDAEVLFWVGCAGAFDSRYKKVTQAIAALLHQAKVRFAILGSEEKCNGDTARRLGNEYLAQAMMKENIETLNRYQVKKIVTGCPHCFNTLKNEYPQFGGTYEVMHHSEYLAALVAEGMLHPTTELPGAVTFHDSCYLGRYNQVYAQPRKLLESVPKIDLVEMARTKDKGFCCGAGGGRMFMEEHEGKRINIERTEEALGTGAQVIGTSCPFCMTMMTDGVKVKEKAEQVSVKDIAEILLESTRKG